MSDAFNILQAAIDNENQFILISQDRKGATATLKGNFDFEKDHELAEAEFLYRHAHHALWNATMSDQSFGVRPPLSMRGLADALNKSIAAYDAADDKSDGINPDEPVVIRVEGPNMYGYDDAIYWHVQSCGEAAVGFDGCEDERHEGMELSIMPIGRGFYFNGRRREKTAS